MRSSLLPCLLALSLTLAACGSSDPKKEGLEAVQAGEWPKAVAKLDEAMKGLAADSPDYMEVAMGHCTALAHVDATKAKTEFEALIVSGKAQVSDFSTIVSHLLQSKQFMPAIDLMDKGLKQFPEHPKMLGIKDSVVAASKEANDPQAQAALKGLGYL